MKLNLKEVDSRKFMGTVVGGIIFLSCILFFTYAYYNWKSENTNVILGIKDLATQCEIGTGIDATNIGPVLDYKDGAKFNFIVDNGTTDPSTVPLTLKITSISDNLKVESFKYVLVQDTSGGTNYDYTNPILSGDFSTMTVGDNILPNGISVAASSTYSYQFIVYIDGNVYNDSNMQENSLVGELILGNCSEKTSLLSNASVGSYVAYEGTGGKVGSTSVACKKNGAASSSTATDETEAPNSCLGQNAREDLETESGKYGYCCGPSYKYNTTGWRIGYVRNGKAMLVSAGSPECISRISSTANETYIKTANARAMKYCNSSYVDGNCTCTDSDGDGLCDSPSTDAWALGDTDFYYMTKAISGYGKRLTDGSSSLGDSGGSLGSTLSCLYSDAVECGYNNDLIDNGGFYQFAARNSASSTAYVFWYPDDRRVYSDGNALADGSRFVISLKSSVKITGGEGTMDNPYTIAAD